MFYVEGSDSQGRRWVAEKSTTKGGATRKCNTLNKKAVAAKRFERYGDTYKVLTAAEYEAYWGEMVERTNLLSGKTFFERRDTPSYCSPSSESYWSM